MGERGCCSRSPRSRLSTEHSGGRSRHTDARIPGSFILQAFLALLDASVDGVGGRAGEEFGGRRVFAAGVALGRVHVAVVVTDVRSGADELALGAGVVADCGF